MSITGQFNLSGQCFLNSFEKPVDAQRRIALPRQWRVNEGGGDQFILIPGRAKSLQLIPIAMFAQIFEKMKQVSFADPNAAVAFANLAATAQAVTCDSQGRIALTPELIAHAGLGKNAVLVGAFTTIQVWNPEDWEKSKMNTDNCLDVLQAIQEKPDDIANILKTSLK